MVATNDRMAVKFTSSPGNDHDVPDVRNLFRGIGNRLAKMLLLMDRAYEGLENRQQSKSMGMDLVVPPLKSRRDAWEYNKELYRKINEVERLFQRLKGYIRVFSRFNKLDIIFVRFIVSVSIYNMIY